RVRAVDGQRADMGGERGTMLDKAAGGVAAAKRYTFADSVKAQISKESGVLVDLSVTGAQVMWPSELEVNESVTLKLPSEDTPVTCKGKVVWSWLEPKSKGKPLRYRAGILFKDPDEAAIEAF